MECCVTGCKSISKHTYNMSGAKFNYCDRHEYIPKGIRRKVNKGFYS